MSNSPDSVWQIELVPYCELLSISVQSKRSYNEKKHVNSGWSVREFKRQIATSLYERLLLSEGKANKETVLTLAEKKIELSTPGTSSRILMSLSFSVFQKTSL